MSAAKTDYWDSLSGATDAISRAWLRRSVMTLALLMSIYIAFSWWLAGGDIARAVRESSLASFPAVIGLVLIGIALRVIRWHYYLRHLGWRRVPVSESILVFLASLAFTATPGKMGEAVKSVLLRTRHQIPISSGVGVLLIERLGDLIAVLMLAVLSFGTGQGATAYIFLSSAAVAAITVVIGNVRIYTPILTRLSRIKRVSGIVERIAESLHACQHLLRPIPFLIGVTIAVAAWSCEAVAFHYLARSAGIYISVTQAASIYGTATVAGVLSALPGGIGGFEVIMVLLLSHLGVPMSSAVPPVALFRLCTLWLGILLGTVFMLIWIIFSRSEARSINPTSKET